MPAFVKVSRNGATGNVRVLDDVACDASGSYTVITLLLVPWHEAEPSGMGGHRQVPLGGRPDGRCDD
jgi:hypothetical protein